MTSKQKEHILRLRRTDEKSEHLLLNVGKNGRRDLDLKLIGTDQYVAFVGTIAEADVKSLQERNYTGDLAEWKTVLRFALLHEKPDGTLPEFLQGVETVAAISGSTSTITVRRNIGGITQRLGSIQLELDKDKNEEVVPMEWVDVAAATSDELRDQLATLEASVQTQKDQIAKLSTELDMLVKAKREHEDELLSKFAALLNAKKLKIRDQQRLLNGAKVDPVAAEEISSARASKTSTRKAGASRGGKRKANSAAPPSPEEQQHGDDDDAETVDGTDDADAASRREQMTPEASDADAATDIDGEDEDMMKKSAAGPAASLRSSTGRSQHAGGTTENMDLDEDLPPPRKLPFNSKKSAPESEKKKHTPPPTSNTNDVGEDAETDDDEL